MNDQSVIAAISSAPGVGAIAVIRLSGEDAFLIADKVFESPSGKKLKDQPANTLHFGSVKENNRVIDDVVASVFKAPHSYTGENILEISCHGSVYIQQKILELLISNGARLAKPGEFTLRAFMNGKMDLSQAEAVADLIASTSESFHRVAVDQMRGGFTAELKKLRDKLLHFVSMIELELDFSEEDVEFADRRQLKELVTGIEALLRMLKDSFRYGNVIKNGIPVAIIGKTNSGKSTLLNLILKEEKAIVSEIEGTTRDYIEDTISVGGFAFRFIDTAGLRHTEDAIEKIGIERTFKKMDQASIILHVVDACDKDESILKSVNSIKKKLRDTDKKQVVILNKTDLLSPEQLEEKEEVLKSVLENDDALVKMSAKKGINLGDLEKVLVNHVKNNIRQQSDVVITNVRHFEALSHSHEAIQRVLTGLDNQIPGDLLAQDIREAMHYLGEITGEITTDEILGNIFKNFCIGK